MSKALTDQRKEELRNFVRVMAQDTLEDMYADWHDHIDGYDEEFTDEELNYMFQGTTTAVAVTEKK